jgi:hypothetical protein
MTEKEKQIQEVQRTPSRRNTHKTKAKQVNIKLFTVAQSSDQSYSEMET